MDEKHIEVEAEGGRIPVLEVLPDGEGPWPLVVFYMDAFGPRPALTGMAERLAGAGYAVVQPDLYWRSAPYEPFDPTKAFNDPEERERLMGLLHSVTPAQVASDTLAVVDEVASDPRIEAQCFGTVGYCMGGRLSFTMAEELPDRVAAAAGFHPGGLVTDAPDSPHRRVDRIGDATIYLGVADEDRSCTPEQQQTLREALDEAGVDYTMELYQGAKHGYAVPDHSVYDEDAAERHWARLLDLFGRALRPAGR